MEKQKSLWRGVVAGVVGGLTAAWMMNEFMAGLRLAEQQTVPSDEEKDGSIVHYAYGALTGGVYGGLAEYSSTVRSGFGTSFGGVLFSAADLLAVPALKLAPEEQATPFAAHIVYGITTELMRRLVRLVL